ncbi:Aldo/keto reductase family protein [Riemerella columbipharyngis]|uniref:Aldo/keto reductase family protein n=1 Tax=Riemerella columbipharyngis TaxID=1071918 RepID=A0A1G6ZJY2_9FLAO|nr:Aldo/keto reductase family protein [Riemerella columbipharyngis]
MPWSPLGVGFLAGTIDKNTRFAQGDIRGIESRFSPENIDENKALLNLVEKWAERKQAGMAQISLAWLLSQKDWIVPIPGTTQMAHMLENTASEAFVFTDSELEAFNSELSEIQIFGERLPAPILRLSGVDAPPKK